MFLFIFRFISFCLAVYIVVLYTKKLYQFCKDCMNKEKRKEIGIKNLIISISLIVLFLILPYFLDFNFFKELYKFPIDVYHLLK